MTLPDNAQLRWCHNGDPRVAHLRGGPVFARWGMHRRDAAANTHLPLLDPRRPVRLLMSLPAHPVVLEWLQTVSRYPDIRVAVDVCFPFDVPDAAATANPELTTDGEAIAFWTDPAHRDVARQAMALADAVTTPYPRDMIGGAGALARHNPNVHVLPDCHTKAHVDEFEWLLLQAWDSLRP